MDLLVLFSLGKPAVTLTGPSLPYCLGETYELTCIHPKLDPEVHHTSIEWRRNGAAFVADGNDVQEEAFSENDTATVLRTSVTMAVNYSCVVLFRNSTESSAEIIIDPQGERFYY